MKQMRVSCRMCGTTFLKPDYQVHENNFCSLDHFRRWCSHRMREFNRTNNPLNRPGGVMESRLRRSRQLRGTGEGKAYRKLLGRHEHRRLAEAKLGRPLRAGEVVHHLDGNKLNNDPANLAILPSQSEHCKAHGFGKKKGR